MRFYVYVIRCGINGKAYVGKTSRPRFRWYMHKCLAKRYAGRREGETHLYRAMRKHGVQHFTFEVIETCETEAHAFDRERHWICQLGTFGPRGYNMTDGGEGVSGHQHKPEAKLRMARPGRLNGCYGRVWTTEERAAHALRTKTQFAERGHPFAGRTHSAETRAKLSAAAKGNKRCVGRKVPPRSQDARDRQSAAIKAKWAEKGGRWYNDGHVVSDETRAKQSASQKAAWTPERRAAAAEATRKRMAALTPEQREANMAAARAAKRAAIPPPTPRTGEADDLEGSQLALRLPSQK